MFIFIHYEKSFFAYFDSKNCKVFKTVLFLPRLNQTHSYPFNSFHTQQLKVIVCLPNCHSNVLKQTDRRSGYPEARAPYSDVPPRGGYEDDRRLPGAPSAYEDRRSLAPPPPTATGYDRTSGGADVYSRRDTGPKPL